MNIRDGTERKIVCVSNDPNRPLTCGDNAYLLTPGELYTFVDCDIYEWHTMVYLREFPNIEFNSCLFEEVGDVSEIEKPYIHPCVFCNSPAIAASTDDGFTQCGCVNCQIMAYDVTSRHGAISKWNNLCYRYLY